MISGWWKNLLTSQQAHTGVAKFLIMADSSFFEDVFDVVRLIPKGRVTSYGAIARYLGTGKSARLVGWAMNASHSTDPNIPAHRVLNRNGMLTGKHHFGAPDTMQKLLEAEGVEVLDDQVIEFKARYWDPNEELGL
jgi:methylated-DNA-protein-cysteine methyltransferase-like protein